MTPILQPIIQSFNLFLKPLLSSLTNLVSINPPSPLMIFFIPSTINPNLHYLNFINSLLYHLISILTIPTKTINHPLTIKSTSLSLKSTLTYPSHFLTLNSPTFSRITTLTLLTFFPKKHSLLLNYPLLINYLHFKLLARFTLVKTPLFKPITTHF
jgi:hypothetical protein